MNSVSTPTSVPVAF